ncbi:aminotransferase class I/II-fold pyridoxal phosphate-dependent enzyme [Micromonospora sp. CPCC 206060]|uniref:pyridoxal phosphate-dependent aminotransferase n=1 Tax=Micromonospora sp. CPCC 206060 TaxID=3122406 RepID=UPI002FF1C4B4
MTVDPSVDDRLLEVFARAVDPDDYMELRDLYLGRVESEIPHGHRPELAERWRASEVRRKVEAEDVLRSRATVRFVKEMFNWYFRDDLYGEQRGEAEIILSSGAVDEEEWGLPWALKDCIRYALDRDLYGYSDSRGREPARDAVAAYENALIPGEPYARANVALTLGATQAINCLADFVLSGAPAGDPALCAIPNYPPLVESVARRSSTRLVPLTAVDGRPCSLDPLIEALTPQTPLVLLQTAANPTGAVVCESDLEQLITAADPSTVIVLDECHEWLGPEVRRTPLRGAPNVVRVSSLSKHWSAPGIKVGWLLASADFIDGYYEYASTTFGGPASFFFTIVEVLARMERWRVERITELDRAHCDEFEAAYGLDVTRLQLAYDSYLLERRAREEELIHIRDRAIEGLTMPGVRVLPARYSINLALNFVDSNDSYRCFREVLHHTGVSVFPGLLTFCLSGGIVRVTSAQRWTELAAAIERLGAYGAAVAR